MRKIPIELTMDGPVITQSFAKKDRTIKKLPKEFKTMESQELLG